MAETAGSLGGTRMAYAISWFSTGTANRETFGRRTSQRLFAGNDLAGWRTPSCCRPAPLTPETPHKNEWVQIVLYSFAYQHQVV